MLDIVLRGGTVVDGTGAPQYTSDIGIRDGRIVEIGRLTSAAKREVDVDGLIVTPGFIDVHTHYDGQATWDRVLDPSFSTGVTTAIMGNCGVGFAPVRSEHHQRLIDLMEGVEEIPGTAFHAGLEWGWNSYPEYLDALDRHPRSFDIGAMLPHGPLRLFVLGDKVGTDKCADGDDLEQVKRLVREAMAAGAFGVSTSRTPVHRTVHGEMTPDFNVDMPELMAIAGEVASFGGMFECAPAGIAAEIRGALKSEMAMLEKVVRKTGVRLHLFTVQNDEDPEFWREQFGWADAINRDGGSVRLQVGGRAVGLLLTFFGIHPFMDRPTFQAVTQLPRDRWLGEISRPEVRNRILAETTPAGSWSEWLQTMWHTVYDLGADYDYEPGRDRALETQAREAGVPVERFIYDRMLESSNEPSMLMAATNYANGSFDPIYEMLSDPASVLSASDAGAHVLSICDGSIFTFMLTHWVRDRTRGPRFPLEHVVNKMTQDAALSVGINDRGALKVGQRADINVIDLDRLRLSPPFMVGDLPDGSVRALQQPSGFRMTMVAGEPTRENDEATGAMPGGLLRFPGRGRAA